LDARDLLQRLAVRWPLVLAGFVLSLLIGGAVFAVTPTNYTAAAGVLVVPPSTDAGSTPVNPLTSLDSVVQVASTLVYTAQTPGAAGQIADASGGGSAAVVNTGSDPTLNTPYIQITGAGNSAADATNAAQAAIKVMSAELSAIQNNSAVPNYLKMRLTTVAQPVSATASGSSRLKAAGLAAGAALVIALVMVSLADRMMLSRKPAAPAPRPTARPDRQDRAERPERADRPEPSRPRRPAVENHNEKTQVIARGMLADPPTRGPARR
jgi:hypothetical protein